MLRIGTHPLMTSLPSPGWMRRLRGNCGGTLVETAFSISILLMLLIGMIEASLMVYTYHFISNAAREGTRYAIVHGSTWAGPPWNNSATCAAYSDAGCTATTQNIQDYVASLAFPGIDTSDILVTPNWYSLPGGTASPLYNAYGDIVKVKVTYAFPFSIPFVPQSTLTMSSTSQMVISQ